MNELGSAIRAERNRRNLKQHHLAELLGRITGETRNTSWISVIENGKRKSPLSRDEVIAIEDALEIEDSRLLAAAGYVPRPTTKLERIQEGAGNSGDIEARMTRLALYDKTGEGMASNVGVSGTDRHSRVIVVDGDRVNDEDMIMIQSVVDYIVRVLERKQPSE